MNWVDNQFTKYTKMTNESNEVIIQGNYIHFNVDSIHDTFLM